jgi:ADP-ribosylation factor related protein 1
VNDWARDGMYLVRILFSIVKVECKITQTPTMSDGVLSNPQILGVPLLLLANKQDSPLSLSVDEIRHDYEDWYQRKLESARKNRYGEVDTNTEMATRRERIASLDVMGVSALEG